jgi:hypothetical protein
MVRYKPIFIISDKQTAFGINYTYSRSTLNLINFNQQPSPFIFTLAFYNVAHSPHHRIHAQCFSYDLSPICPLARSISERQYTYAHRPKDLVPAYSWTLSTTNHLWTHYHHITLCPRICYRYSHYGSREALISNISCHPSFMVHPQSNGFPPLSTILSFTPCPKIQSFSGPFPSHL